MSTAQFKKDGHDNTKETRTQAEQQISNTEFMLNIKVFFPSMECKKVTTLENSTEDTKGETQTETRHEEVDPLPPTI